MRPTGRLFQTCVCVLRAPISLAVLILCEDEWFAGCASRLKSADCIAGTLGCIRGCWERVPNNECSARCIRSSDASRAAQSLWSLEPQVHNMHSAVTTSPRNQAASCCPTPNFQALAFFVRFFATGSCCAHPKLDSPTARKIIKINSLITKFIFAKIIILRLGLECVCFCSLESCSTMRAGVIFLSLSANVRAITENYSHCLWANYPFTFR